MKDKTLDTFISTVLVADRDTMKVSEKIRKIAEILKNRYTNYEIIIVDNGLEVSESQKVRELLREVACIRVLYLSKIKDLDTAVFAGIDASIGDKVCILYNNDPEKYIVNFIGELNKGYDIVFGVAKNLHRKSRVENRGAKFFYWYNRRFLNINIPDGSTYFTAMRRSAVNALSNSGRHAKHLRYLSKQIGFKSTNYEYRLPAGKELYKTSKEAPLLRAINLISTYSSHPLRALTYFGVVAGVFNIIYAFYVLVVNISSDDVAEGWTTLSLQSSFMFFLVFIILAMLSEYIGQILEESRDESSYHIKQELSSTIGVPDATRKNVTREN